MDADHEQKWAAAQHYLHMLRAGDAHAVNTATLLRIALSESGHTLHELETDESEIAECILRGRKLTAYMFIEYLETGKLTNEAVEHFLAQTLRYGTTHYKEVAHFILDLIHEFELPVTHVSTDVELFYEFIRFCYCIVAKCHLISLREFNDLTWLKHFEEIVVEGEIDLKNDLDITRERIWQEQERIHDHWLALARTALEKFRVPIDDIASLNTAKEQEMMIGMARYQGGVTLAQLCTTEREVRQLAARLEFHEKLRANASNN